MNKNEPMKSRTGRGLLGRTGRACLGVLLLLILVAGSFFSDHLRAISRQEFFSYHMTDLVSRFTGGDTAAFDVQQNTYEESLHGELFGVAEGRNLIVIQLESFQNFLIDRRCGGVEITPNLNRLIRGDSIYFDNYFMQVSFGNTSDAEFATNNSIYGSAEYYTYSLYQNNHYRGLPVLLRERGYDTAAFHGYKKEFWNREAAYPSQGFRRFYSERDFSFDEILGFGIRDDEFFEQSVGYMKRLSRPFYAFLVTLSSHHPYTIPDSEPKLPLRPGVKSDLVYDYINSVHFADKCLGEFIDKLKENGLYDNSILAIYGDHFGLSAEDREIQRSMTRLLGREYTVDQMANIPLIIHIPGEDVHQTRSIAGGQLDFLPTIAYLMGFETLDTLYLGQNLMTAESGFVAQAMYFPVGSFIRDDMVYVMAKDALFNHGSAWNRKTGQKVDLEPYKKDSERAAALFFQSQHYLQSDAVAGFLGQKANEPNRRLVDMQGVGISGSPESEAEKDRLEEEAKRAQEKELLERIRSSKNNPRNEGMAQENRE